MAKIGASKPKYPRSYRYRYESGQPANKMPSCWFDYIFCPIVVTASAYATKKYRSFVGAERFIRTLKENLLWVRHFETIEELRQALLAFRETYNETWLIERHGYLTPSQFRQRQLQPVADAA